jgi:hypothetical protein
LRLLDPSLGMRDAAVDAVLRKAERVAHEWARPPPLVPRARSGA